jgi:hypothetical protein
MMPWQDMKKTMTICAFFMVAIALTVYALQRRNYKLSHQHHTGLTLSGLLVLIIISISLEG